MDEVYTLRRMCGCLKTVVLLGLLRWDTVVRGLSPLDDYILHHEGLNYDTTHLHSQHVRSTRSADDTVRLKFTAYGRTFHLRLAPDTSVFSKTHELVFGGKIFQEEVNIAYRGKLEGSPDSVVYGTIINGIFQGEIHEPDIPTLHMEESTRFFQGEPPYHSVIYSEKHLVMDPYRHLRQNGTHHQSTCGHSHEKGEDSHFHTGHADSDAFEPSVTNSLHRYRRATIQNGQLLGTAASPNTCTLELQSDPYLWRYMTTPIANGGLGKNDQQARDEIMSLFVSHVNSLSNIFKTTRFNTFDNSTWYRGITFIVQRSKIMQWADEKCGETNAGIYCKENYDVNSLLYQWSLSDHSSVCLSYLFTYRDFQKGTLGLAWVAKPSASLTGGICEPYRESVEKDNRRVKKSLNTGVVSLLNYGKRVAVRISQLTFAHEVGHSFGAEHDSSDACAPYGKNRPDSADGNYIMYSSANPGNLPHNNKFSACSRDYIAKVLYVVINKLENKINCFKPSGEAYCGNKIVEKGEECDCGFKDECKSNTTCCEGRSEGMDDGCVLTATRPGSSLKPQCSPTQGPCCSASCTFIPESQRLSCKDEEECSYESICNGTSGKCPPPEPRPDLQFCDDNTHVCEDGQCLGSICHRIEGGGWDECFYAGDWKTEAEEMCYVSCKNPADGSCVSSRDTAKVQTLPAFKALLEEVGNGTLQPVQLARGSPCQNFQGYCDVFHKCRQIDSEGAFKRLLNFFDAANLEKVRQWMEEKWWAVMLMCIGLVLAMAAFIKLCSYSTPTDRPGRKPRRQQKEIREVNPLSDAQPMRDLAPPSYDSYEREKNQGRHNYSRAEDRDRGRHGYTRPDHPRPPRPDYDNDHTHLDHGRGYGQTRY